MDETGSQVYFQLHHPSLVLSVPQHLTFSKGKARIHLKTSDRIFCRIYNHDSILVCTGHHKVWPVSVASWHRNLYVYEENRLLPTWVRAYQTCLIDEEAGYSRLRNFIKRCFTLCLFTPRFIRLLSLNGGWQTTLGTLLPPSRVDCWFVDSCRCFAESLVRSVEGTSHVVCDPSSV